MNQRNITATDAVLTVNYIGFVYRNLVADGYCSDRILKNTGLTAQDLSNTDSRCSFEQHKTLVQNAIAETGDAHLGPRMASRFNPVNIGLPAVAAISSDVLATALEILKQFVSLNFSILTFDFYEENEQLMLHWSPVVDVSEIEYFVLGSSFVICENLLKLLLNEEKVSQKIELSMEEPPGWEAFSQTLDIVVCFNAPSSRMVLPGHYLIKPMSGSDPAIHKHMLALCEKQLSEFSYDRGVDAQVRELLVQRQYQSLPIAEVASELGMSERSLRRRLSNAGTSYKKIFEELRHSRACELLAVPSLPISTIAYDLGYSDPSNFARSFKRWTGLSPVEFRDSL